MPHEWRIKVAQIESYQIGKGDKCDNVMAIRTHELLGWHFSRHLSDAAQSGTACIVHVFGGSSYSIYVEEVLFTLRYNYI